MPLFRVREVCEGIAEAVMEVAETGELDPDRIVIEARYNVRKLFANA